MDALFYADLLPGGKCPTYYYPVKRSQNGKTRAHCRKKRNVGDDFVAAPRMKPVRKPGSRARRSQNSKKGNYVTDSEMRGLLQVASELFNRHSDDIEHLGLDFADMPQWLTKVFSTFSNLIAEMKRRIANKTPFTQKFFDIVTQRIENYEAKMHKYVAYKSRPKRASRHSSGPVHPPPIAQPVRHTPPPAPKKKKSAGVSAKYKMTDENIKKLVSSIRAIWNTRAFDIVTGRDSDYGTGDLNNRSSMTLQDLKKNIADGSEIYVTPEAVIAYEVLLNALQAYIDYNQADDGEEDDILTKKQLLENNDEGEKQFASDVKAATKAIQVIENAIKVARAIPEEEYYRWAKKTDEERSYEEYWSEEKDDSDED